MRVARDEIAPEPQRRLGLPLMGESERVAIHGVGRSRHRACRGGEGRTRQIGAPEIIEDVAEQQRDFPVARGERGRAQQLGDRGLRLAEGIERATKLEQEPRVGRPICQRCAEETRGGLGARSGERGWQGATAPARQGAGGDFIGRGGRSFR